MAALPPREHARCVRGRRAPPGPRSPPILVETAVTAEEFLDQAAALRWLDAEHRAMIDLIEADAPDDQARAWQLASVLEDFLERTG